MPPFDNSPIRQFQHSTIRQLHPVVELRGGLGEPGPYTFSAGPQLVLKVEALGGASVGPLLQLKTKSLNIVSHIDFF